MLTGRIIKIDVRTCQCIACGVMFTPNRFTKQESRKLCATDDFWYDKTFIIDDKNVARVNGQHYIIGNPDAHLKGMGGQTHTIEFYDGREVITDNLWHQGRIPEHWQDWLYNNAEFKEVK